MSWFVYAFFSALFAALTAILAKIGVKGIDSNLATAIRTIIILLFAWGIVLFQGTQKQLSSLSSYTYVFLILSGIATGVSWLFYFKALQVGNASQVVAMDKLSLVVTIILAGFLLRERITLQVVIGALLMTVGAIVISLNK